MTTLALLLTESAAQYPERVAVRHDDRALTYAELDDAAARVAAVLTARGVGPGSAVGLMLPNVPEFAVCYYGILRTGAAVVPMNPLLTAREVGYQLADAGASVLIGASVAREEGEAGARHAGAVSLGLDDVVPLLASAVPQPAPVPRADDDVAVLLYTSGTAGRPKGADLTHANLRCNAALVATTLLRLTPDDVVLGCLPLFHAFGQSCGLNAVVCAGASLTLVPRFSGDVALQVIRRDGVTVVEGVPTMFSALLAAADDAADAAGDARTVRLGVSGGAALPVEVLRAVEDRFGFPIIEGYGLSEASPVVTFNHPDRERNAGSIGTPVRGVEVRLVDDAGADVRAVEVGEIAVRGHNVMRGYRNRPQATAEAAPDGWFRTGDLARVDADGYCFVVGRKKDLIVRGGYNVYPREIEEVLHEHPAVAEAAVVGIPHRSLGEEVGAAVTLDRCASDGMVADIREFVRARVAAYKYPRRVWVVDELPKGPTGTVLRREVRVPREQQS